jgi:hypothetical protein
LPALPALDAIPLGGDPAFEPEGTDAKLATTSARLDVRPLGRPLPIESAGARAMTAAASARSDASPLTEELIPAPVPVDRIEPGSALIIGDPSPVPVPLPLSDPLELRTSGALSRGRRFFSRGPVRRHDLPTMLTRFAHNLRLGLGRGGFR